MLKLTNKRNNDIGKYIDILREEINNEEQYFNRLQKVERNIDLEEVKNELVNSEKTRILNMHSSSHYNALRRSISIKFF